MKINAPDDRKPMQCSHLFDYAAYCLFACLLVLLFVCFLLCCCSCVVLFCLLFVCFLFFSFPRWFRKLVVTGLQYFVAFVLPQHYKKCCCYLMSGQYWEGTQSAPTMLYMATINEPISTKETELLPDFWNIYNTVRNTEITLGCRTDQ